MSSHKKSIFLLVSLIGVAIPVVGDAFQSANIPLYSRTVNRRQYEMKDHLGNTRAVVGDVKVPVNISQTAERFDAALISSMQCDPFGMELPDRTYASSYYRYGFNGKEKDNEWKGTGNSYDFGARIYDPRIARWLSTDPMDGKYPGVGPYNFALNNPVTFIDPDGRDVTVTEKFKKSQLYPVFEKISQTRTFFHLAIYGDLFKENGDIVFSYEDFNLSTLDYTTIGERFDVTHDDHTKNENIIFYSLFFVNFPAIPGDDIFNEDDAFDPTFVAGIMLQQMAIAAASDIHHDISEDITRWSRSYMPFEEPQSKLLTNPGMRKALCDGLKEFDILYHGSKKHSEDWYQAISYYLSGQGFSGDFEKLDPAVQEKYKDILGHEYVGNKDGTVEKYIPLREWLDKKAKASGR